jgi:hypothetical protein
MQASAAFRTRLLRLSWVGWLAGAWVYSSRTVKRRCSVVWRCVGAKAIDAALRTKTQATAAKRNTRAIATENVAFIEYKSIRRGALSN